MNKTIQYFSEEYLKRCEGMTADQIIDFLESYRLLFSTIPEKSQLISLKIEPSLLKAFKRRAELEGTPYQTLIKQLMKAWIQHSDA